MSADRRPTPLDGILVVDLSHALAGPYAAMMLGDLGARVVKIERPGGGDDTRSWGPPFLPSAGADRESSYFLSCNRNKESVVLDLKSEMGKEAVSRLLARADVLIENFRPGVLDRLGLSTAYLEELNPRLVTLSVTSFGRTGPDADRVAYDQIIQGEAGLMSITGPDAETPTKVGVPISDLLAGMHGAIGVLAALHRRQTTGRGDVVRTSLLASVVAAHSFQGTRWTVAHEMPTAEGNRHPSLAPYGAFRAADGLLQVAVGSEALWKRFAPLVGIPPDHPRFSTNGDRVANRSELGRLVEAALGTQTVDHWLAAITEAGVPAGRIRTLPAVYEWEQVVAQGLVLEVDHCSLGPIRLPGTPLQFDNAPAPRHRAPPTLGQHTDEVLEWLGLA